MAIITTPLPYIFSNGTTADATLVNADLNQIVNNVNANAAENGANTSITSLANVTTMAHALSLGSTLGVTGLLTASGGASVATGLTVTGGTTTDTETVTGLLTASGGISGTNVTLSAQPLGLLRGSVTKTGASSSTFTGFGTTASQGGMTVNAGAGTITVPSNGWYLAYVSGGVQTGAQNINATIIINKNGSAATAGAQAGISNSPTATSFVLDIGFSVLVQCVTSDVFTSVYNGTGASSQASMFDFTVVKLF